MEDLFARLLDKSPKVNPAVMDGLACIYMPKAESYIDQVFKSVAQSFPPGLKYLGYQRCTPYEEFDELSKLRSNTRRLFDIAKNNLYLMKYFFSYNDEPLDTRFIWLPYVNEAGLMYLSGTLYHVTPVLSDKVISPGIDSIFVRLLRDKLSFRRCQHTIVVDGQRETMYVVWSMIHRVVKDNKKVPPTTRAFTTNAHYLFAKYGFSYVFEKYTGYVPVAGGEEINPETYAPDKWVICETAHADIKPKAFIGNFYKGTGIRLAIPKDHWTPVMKNFVAGFYYVIDHFPDRWSLDELDNTQLWMILLGHIIYSGHYGENKLYEQIRGHFTSINDYVDSMIVEKLEDSGFDVKNFYDLLAELIKHFNTLILDNQTSSTGMFGKSLEVLYYMLYEITSSLIRANFKLNKMLNKADGFYKKQLTWKDVNDVFVKNIRMGAVFTLTNPNVVTETVSYSGDHKYPKITAKITEQEALPGATRGKSKRHVVGEEQHLDISMVEGGNILFLSKSNPTPSNHLNPYVILDMEKGTIVPNPKFKELRDRTEKMLKER